MMHTQMMQYCVFQVSEKNQSENVIKHVIWDSNISNWKDIKSEQSLTSYHEPQ